MNDGFAWWLIVLGIAIGVGLVWLFLVKLPRTESDVDDSEMVAEAVWISQTIENYGGVAPQALVEEILEMHRQYLSSGVPAAPAPEPEEAFAAAEPAADLTPVQPGGRDEADVWSEDEPPAEGLRTLRRDERQDV
jgi:hypothetical protein